MPEIVGVDHLSLSVTDRKRSTDWYRDVLGFSVAPNGENLQGPTFGRTRLIYGAADRPALILTLTEHDERPGDRFTPVRAGLDHVALRVRSRSDLDEFKERLEKHGVRHSEIKPMRKRIKPTDDDNWMITLRDPDNIQLELYFRAAP